MNRFTKRFFQPTEDQLKLHFRRFEFKYPLTITQYQDIKPIVAKRLKLDPFAGANGFYSIESIYLDTPTHTAYQQAKAGIKNRVKHRLRTYPDSTRGSQYVFWEIKRKKDMTVIKDRSPLTMTKTLKALEAKVLPRKNQPTLKKFLFDTQRYLLKPKILIRYRREPFIKHTPSLRITFDSQIEVSNITGIWQSRGENHVISPHVIVMELKFTSSLPYWLAGLVREHNLERQPFSKYTLSLEKAKPHLPWIIS